MPRHWWYVVGWACFIQLLLLWPAPPRLQAAWMPFSVDTLAHAALFAGQAALAARALRAERRALWPAAVGAALFGAVTELQQHFMPSRSMELGDLLADVAGALIGLAAFVALAPRRREFHG
ncbi:MAG: VanZ family protein [Gemmatimonadetes bacterium]|nr:VanZ family protein [Gemmatimonadota bacterium]